VFLLDTDICSYLMEERYSVLHDKLRATPPELLYISAVTQGEILFGYAWKSLGLRRQLAA